MIAAESPPPATAAAAAAAAAAVKGGRATVSVDTATNIEDLHGDVLGRSLRLLDGPALAAVSCASSRLHSLASEPDLWRHLCLATWPSLRSHSDLLRLISTSFPDSHRSFFADAFPCPCPCPSGGVLVADADEAPDGLCPSLISAVDLYHNGAPVFSRVVETDVSTPWFRSSPFRIDALDRKDPSPRSPAPEAETVISPDELTLSWVVVDPEARRAVNVSSRRPVAVDRHWFTGETVVRFATVIEEGCAVTATVTCGEDAGHVREMSLTVEGVDGICLSGRESLAVFRAAMSGERRRWEGESAARRLWGEFVGRRRRRKEMAARREGAVDLACAALGATAFLTFLVLVVFK